MFRTQFSERVKVITASGDPIKKVFSPRWREDGNLELVETGSINIYDEIQSHKDSVDINVLLAKYAKTGDLEILNKATTQFMDVSGLPTSIVGFYNLVEDGRRLYDGLPADEKSKYNNSFENFIFQFGRQPQADSVPAPVEVTPDVKE